MSTFLFCTERNASLAGLKSAGPACGYTRSPGDVVKMMPCQQFWRLGATCLMPGWSMAVPITYCGVLYVYVRTLLEGLTFQSSSSSNPLGPTPGRRATYA